MWKVPCCILLLGISISVALESADARGVRDRRKYYEEEYESEEFSPEQDGVKSVKLIGKWRNNGEALEPKWRDGDSVPLVPFYEATIPPGGPKEEKSERTRAEILDEESSPEARERRPGRVTRPRISARYQDSPTRESTSTEPAGPLDDGPREGYRENPESSSGSDGRPRERRKYKKQDAGGLYEDLEIGGSRLGESKQDKVLQDRKILLAANENLEGAAMRYGETFQNHPHALEFDDDEYEKPRPRKRRPPQNYEFEELKNSYPVFLPDMSTSRPDHSGYSGAWKEPGEGPRNGLSRSRDRPGSNMYDKLSENSELKTLLKMKQGEGLSLSEILQQRNLTLADLLKGTANIINVLKGDDKEVQEEVLETTTRPRWTPSQRIKPDNIETTRYDVLTGDISRMPSTEKSSEVEEKIQEVPEVSQKFAIDELTKSVILSEFTTSGDSPLTGSTTEGVRENSPEFVGVLPNDEDAKNADINQRTSSEKQDDDEIMEFSDFTVKKPSTTTSRVTMDSTTGSYEVAKSNNIFHDAESTLSIEHILSPTVQSIVIVGQSENNGVIETNEEDDRRENFTERDSDSLNITNTFDTFEVDYQSDGVQLNVEDRDEDRKETSETTLEGKKGADVEGESETREKPPTIIDLSPIEDEGIRNHRNSSNDQRLYDDVISEIEPEARAEIFELFSSGSSAKRLERILRSRNMSIDELIALRQRGSSQVHLAEVSRHRGQNSRSPKMTNGPPDPGKLNGTVEEGRKKWHHRVDFQITREPDELLELKNANIQRELIRDNDGTFVGINEDIYDKDNATGVKEQGSDVRMMKAIEILDILTAFDSLPFSKDIEPSHKSYDTDIIKVRFPAEDGESKHGNMDYSKKIEKTVNRTESRELDRVEEARKNETEPSDIVYQPPGSIEIVARENNDPRTLSKVKPSIIASGAILGVTVVVFLAIFIACRVRQKQKYTYRNTFSKTVFQAPAMTARKLSNSSSLNTIMVNVIATSTTKRPERQETRETDDDFDFRSDIENDSLDANDSWETIPDFMKSSHS